MSYQSLNTLIQEDVNTLLSAQYGAQFGDAIGKNTDFPFLLIDSWTDESNRRKGAASMWTFSLTLTAITGYNVQGHAPVTNLVEEAAELVRCNAKAFPLANETEGESTGQFRVMEVIRTNGNSNRGSYNGDPQWTASAVVTFQITRRL